MAQHSIMWDFFTPWKAKSWYASFCIENLKTVRNKDLKNSKVTSKLECSTYNSEYYFKFFLWIEYREWCVFSSPSYHLDRTIVTTWRISMQWHCLRYYFFCVSSLVAMWAVSSKLDWYIPVCDRTILIFYVRVLTEPTKRFKLSLSRLDMRPKCFNITVFINLDSCWGSYTSSRITPFVFLKSVELEELSSTPLRSLIFDLPYI